MVLPILTFCRPGFMSLFTTGTEVQKQKHQNLKSDVKAQIIVISLRMNLQ